VVLAASLVLWAGMLGFLGFRRAQGVDRANSAYLDALFGPDAPVLESKSVWLRENLSGVEKRIGFYETQLTQVGHSDVHIKHTLELSAKQAPPAAALTIRALITQLTGQDEELHDFNAQLDVYVNRLRGLRSLKARAKYGPERLEVWGQPRGDGHLRVITRWGPEDHSSVIPYDSRTPFGVGSSPFVGMKNLAVDQSWKVSFFDPFTRTANDRLIKVVGREKLKYRGQEVDCFVLTSHPVAADRGGAGGGAANFGLSTSTAWVSADRGQLLREETRILMFTLSVVLEDSVTAEERDYKKKLESPLEGAGAGKPGEGTVGPEEAGGKRGSDRNQ
jgi:hypothetical protein